MATHECKCVLCNVHCVYVFRNKINKHIRIKYNEMARSRMIHRIVCVMQQYYTTHNAHFLFLSLSCYKHYHTHFSLADHFDRFIPSEEKGEGNRISERKERERDRETKKENRTNKG